MGMSFLICVEFADGYSKRQGALEKHSTFHVKDILQYNAGLLIQHEPSSSWLIWDFL